MERVRKLLNRSSPSSVKSPIKGTVEKNLAESGVSIPLAINAVASAFSTNFPAVNENRYSMYRRFLKMDPELNNAVTRLALLAQFSYKGILLKTDTTPTEQEKQIVKTANKEADLLDYRSKFYSYSRRVIRDGDAVFVAALADNIGVQQIQPLPMSLTTCLENRDQIGDAGAIIQQRNLYVVNEKQTSSVQKISEFPVNIPGRPVYHIAMDNEAEEIYDNLGRYTFGVWSESPIDCLKTQVLWKQAVKITDILWRYRNVPREVHKLDTSMFTPEKFSGANWEAQIAAAQAAAQKYLDDYGTAISKKSVDQGYVVGSNVTEISYVQPGGQRAGAPQATAPNELINQINESIREGIGAYTIGKGTYATELVTASYVILMPDWVAYKVQRAFTDLLRNHLRLKYHYPDEILERIEIRRNLVLDILKGELARQVALFASANIKTKNELREMTGDQPLTEEQKKEIFGEGQSSPGRENPIQTLNDIEANAERTREEPQPITPQSRADKQRT